MVTEKNFKELEKSQASLTLTVDAASIEKAYNERLAKYAKTVEMPGFRKGHVPTNVLERKFGEGIRQESTFDCMEENLKEAIASLDEKDRPLSYSVPELQDEENLLPFKKDQDITFTVIYDIYPRFELPQYKGLEVEVKDAEITEKDVEDQIEVLREQNAMVVKKDGKVENGDIVNIDYTAYNEDGSVDEKTSRTNFTFTVGTKYNFFKLDDDVVGLAKDETKTIEKAITKEDDIPGFEGKTVKIDIKVNEVKRRDIPEVDDDFAQDVKAAYKTVEDLKNGVKADLEKQLATQLDRDRKDALMNKIASLVSFDIPTSMVNVTLENDWNNFVRQSGVSEEQLLSFFKAQGQTKEVFMEGWREPATADLKKELILTKIAETENFPISDEEIEKECGETLSKLDSEETKESYKNMVKENLQYAKALPFLLENNTLKSDKKLSFKEYTEGKSEE